MKPFLYCLCALAGLTATVSAAQAPTEVVVIGNRPAEKIDRTIYDVASDPDAASGVIIDILPKVPGVAVTPDGQVLVRGAAVTILVDGKVPADGNAVVKLLASADVARIEVITNASAQYGPGGTSVVINIVTRKRRLHLSGDLNLQGNSRGQGGAAFSATFNRGPWSAGAQARLDHWQNRSRVSERRRYLVSPGAYDVLYREDRLHSASDEATGGLSAEYRPGPHGSLSLKGDYGRYDALTKGASAYTGSDTYEEETRIASTSRNGSFQAQYEYRGEAGENISLNLDHSDYANRTVSAYDREGEIYATAVDIGGHNDRLQGDYERRYGRRLLTVGAYIDRTSSRDASSLDAGDADLALAVADYDHAFSGVRTISAAYVTWQTPLGRWTVLPGLRLEYEQLSLPGAKTDDMSLFPSLHVSRTLDEAARLRFSYARRITRPALGEYNPDIDYHATRIAVGGNARLRPQFTDSYEAAYDLDSDAFGFSASVYYRDTSGSLSTFSQVTPAGLWLTTSVNAGRSHSSGVEVTLRGRMSKSLKYTLNGTLFQATTPFIDGATWRMRGAVSGSGNALLEYAAANGDRYQVNLTGFGRRLTYQGYTGGAWRTDVSYRHPLGDRLAVVVSVTDLFDTYGFRNVVDTEALRIDTENRANMRALKVALSYRFGDDG